MDPSVQYQEFFINELGYPLGQQGPGIRSEMDAVGQKNVGQRSTSWPGEGGQEGDDSIWTLLFLVSVALPRRRHVRAHLPPRPLAALDPRAPRDARQDARPQIDTVIVALIVGAVLLVALLVIAGG